MRQTSEHWREVESLMDHTPNVFPNDLIGQTAGGAALDLIEHWATCGAEIDLATKRGDVDDVIAVLRRWRDSLI